MRVLLGTKCFANFCKHRIRWHHRSKSYLPPQQLYDAAKKVVRAHRLGFSFRFLSGKGKSPETPTLDIICRVLASAKNYGESSGKPKEPLKFESVGQTSTSSSSQASTTNPLHIKGESPKQPSKGQLEPEIVILKTPQIFNCKNCYENSPEIMIVKCKNCIEDGHSQSTDSVMGKATSLLQENSATQLSSVLKKEPSTSASKPSVGQSLPSVAPKKRDESPSSTSLKDRFSMPQKSAFPMGRNPCFDGKKDKKSKCPPPKPKPCSSSKDEHKPPVKKRSPSKSKSKDPPKTVDSTAPRALKTENASAKPKIASPPPNKAQTDKSHENPKVGFNMPSNSAFPLGRNPCVDGKNDKKVSKCAAADSKPQQKAKKDDKPKVAAKSECKLEKKKESCPSAFVSEKAATVPSDSPKPPEGIAPKAEPRKKKSMRQGVVKPKETPAKPNKQPKDRGLPPVSTSRFSMPLMMAFPIGRNPCRDGPRGSSKKEESACGKKVVNDCHSTSNSCQSKKNRSNAADSERTSSSLKSVSQKVFKQSDATTSVESRSAPVSKALPQTSPPVKEISMSALPSPKDPSISTAKAPLPPIKETKTPPAPQPSPSNKEIKSPKPLSKTQYSKRSNCEVKTQCAEKPQKVPKTCKKSKIRHLADASNDPNKKPELKKFPALPLKQSIASYISSIEPFLTEEELKVEQKVAKKFVDNEGAKLQELLEAEAECTDNWLTPRWTRSAYLTYQAPLTVFSSPGLSFPIQEFKDTNDFLNFTAKAIYGMCEFKQLVDQHKIPVVKMGKNCLDNSQFGKIFGTVRKPGRFCDTIEQYNDADYIVVVYNNNYFKLPIYSQGGTLLHAHTLRDALQDILECPIKVGKHFGLLTHDNRSNWAEAYTVLCRHHGNADTVETIEQSLFVVCLDNCVPTPKGEERIVQAHQLLHGGGVRQNSANRWMDKTIQLIVNPNGLAGFCYEHSPADCQPLAMLMDFVQLKVTEANYGCDGCEADKKVTSTLLKFQPINECINLWLCQARRNIQRIVSQLQMNVINFECYGKCFIKAQGLNPDSYIQMALSLAYYTMHGKIPAQYESAHLRIFTEGRTETIRSTSNESKTFLLTMQSEKASMREKLAALQKAVDAHEKLIKEAINGQGIDRHLFGLQEMALEKGMPMPEFFRSKGYVRSVTFQLFTSQVATSNEGFMAYGPLLSDGYGVCYNPKERKITFAISAWKSCKEINTIRFGKAIKKSLNDMRKLILLTGGDHAGEHPCKCEKVLV
ncbi:choline O-acetyltransferase [Drosophila mauritiana]|uniref:Choline O-acetyltransferase n=1 Tax=Drosophila mauritiana TaxID=7226 RepID=A0A6P8LDU8_DROMA|nr:choline O-acetyltransferase [Drosophila mauritiana]